MFNDVKAYIHSCLCCQWIGKLKIQEWLYLIPVGGIFEQVCVDVKGSLLVSKTGMRYIIVAMDHLTKWCEAQPVLWVDATKISLFLYECIMCCHRYPMVIMTDNGWEFTNILVHAVTGKFNIKHQFSMVYHPQTNSLVKQFNQTLGGMLWQLSDEYKEN